MRMSNRQKNALRQGSQMEPRFSSGRRLIVLGFLVKPGMHTAIRHSPLGI